MNTKIVTFGNVKIEGYESDYVFQRIQKTQNYYEIENLTKWQEYFAESNMILDIGANLGNHTVFFSQNTKAERIISFEPFGPNFERLKRNVELNNIDNKVCAVKLGVGDRIGFSEVSSFSSDNYGATSLGEVSGTKTEDSLEITTVDTYLRENDIIKCDFVKIDTEGFEISVLKGMVDTIRAYHPTLWIEVSYETVGEILSVLYREQYKLVDVFASNLLFVYEGDSKSTEITTEKLLEDYFVYKDKADKYYGEYCKSSEDRKKIKELTKELIHCYEDYKHIEVALENERNHAALLLNRNEELTNEVERLNSRLDIIRNNRFGKIAIKAYKFYKRKIKKVEG